MHERVWMIEEFGRGGIARYASDVAGLIEGTAAPVVATTSAGPAEGTTVPAQVWFPTADGADVRKVYAAFAGLLRALRVVRRGDVAWVPLGIRPLFEIALIVTLRAAGGRVIATLHNRHPHGRRRAAGLVRFSARLADVCVVHTRALMEWATSENIHVELLPFPPPSEDLHGTAGRHDRSSLGAEPDELLVLLLGNLYPYKGTDVLLHALADALAAVPELPLRVILAGRLHDRFDPMLIVRSRGLESKVTVLPGYREPGELIDLLEAADVVALPYRQVDHSGVGALVAARGLPAVASDLPGLRELFGDTALYVRPGDVGDLAHALCRLPEELPHLQMGSATPSGDLAAAYQTFVATQLRAGRA